jgi:hypothetical protein
VALNNRVSLLAVLPSLGGLALTVACSSDSAGPGPLPSCGAHGTQLSLAVGAYTSIDPASDSGCVTFAANSGVDTAEYLVLPWSAGGTAGSSAPFRLQSAEPAASIPMSRAFAPAARSNRGLTAVAFDRFLRELGSTGRYPLVNRSAPVAAAVEPRPSPAAPPPVGDARTFRVCANMSCSTLNNVGAVARAVGQHIAIYIDTLAPSPGLSAVDLDSLKNVFDSRLYPLDTTTFGHVSDIDSNSVVIVLMSNQVNKLVTTAQCNSSGYIAGFFFPGDLAPGFSTTYNDGEVFYSIVADSTGSLSCAHKNSEVTDVTPVTFTHEFQHMINFVEHVLVRNANRSEEGWLDEGLSKYAEELAGRSYLAQADTAMFSKYAIGAVYDGYQYLLAPGDTPLMIPADTGTLAMVGASWLFTRYIVDQFGDSLPGRLVQTTLTGAANVAGQTGQPFAQTISRWALANWVSDLPGFSAPNELQYTKWHFRRTFSSLHSQDAQNFPLVYPLVPAFSAGTAVNVTGTLHSGSGEYVRAVQPPAGAAFTLHLSANGTTAVSPAVVPRLVVLRIR